MVVFVMAPDKDFWIMDSQEGADWIPGFSPPSKLDSRILAPKQIGLCDSWIPAPPRPHFSKSALRACDDCTV